MKLYLLVILLLVLVIFSMGFALPFLISASSDFAVFVAAPIVVVAILPLFYYIIKQLFKEFTKNESIKKS